MTAGPTPAAVVDTGFDATSTAAQVVAGIDLSGRTAVVTGGASGIGLETARALAGAGAWVVMAVRDAGAGARAAEDIASTTGDGGSVEVAALDLADLASVDAFTSAWSGPLDLLVANAGVMQTPERYTSNGWEWQMATNHLGHFALATGLHGALARAGSSRVVVLSSSGHASSPVVFDDLFFDRRPYDPSLAYGQSKSANALFAVEASRRWSGEGITANAVMPGGVWTGLQKNWDAGELAATKASAPPVGSDGQGVKTPQQGAATSVWAATSPALEGVGGLYLEDCHQAAVVDRVADGLHGVMAHAIDPDAARRLWQVSEELITAARTGDDQRR